MDSGSPRASIERAPATPLDENNALFRPELTNGPIGHFRSAAPRGGCRRPSSEQNTANCSSWPSPAVPGRSASVTGVVYPAQRGAGDCGYDTTDYAHPSTSTSLLVVVAMAQLEQVLNFRIAQKGFRLFAIRKFDDDHAFGFPVALDRRGHGALNDICPGMLRDEGGDLREVFPKTAEVIHRQIEHQIRFHAPPREPALGAGVRAVPQTVPRMKLTRAKTPCTRETVLLYLVQIRAEHRHETQRICHRLLFHRHRVRCVASIARSPRSRPVRTRRFCTNFRALTAHIPMRR